MSDPIVIELMGGHCPVQAEGTICGEEFYFRARGDRWSLGIGGDVVAAPEWMHSAPYGTWPDAGWMDVKEAESLLRQAAVNYITQFHPERLVDLPQPACEPSLQGSGEPSLPSP